MLPLCLSAQQEEDLPVKKIDVPVQIRMIRVYGAQDEINPPVVLIQPDRNSVTAAVGEKSVIIEFDVDAPVPPNLYARFVHCTIDWKETENVFINDAARNRTSNIEWESAPTHASHYKYRGRIEAPNSQIEFKYSGNWKVKLYELYEDETVIAEARFFVVKPIAGCRVDLYTDFYDPAFKVTRTSYTIEALVSSRETLFENRLNTVAIYRNHRWYEPFYISKNSTRYALKNRFRYHFPTRVSGFTTVEKKFRIENIPAENGYRILDLTNVAEYPLSGGPIRMPFSDFIRNGHYNYRDDDGAMITHMVTPYYDDYVYVEMVLDPDYHQSRDEVFVSGSFNNWNPDGSWRMYYDEESRLYKVRHWIRRGRHNYLYGSGNYNREKQRFVDYSYDEFEGNTSTSGHTFLAFVYYQSFDNGGYDQLIGVGAANVFGNIRR
jgi:hypothetical protein